MSGIAAAMKAVALPMTIAGGGIAIAGASMRAGDEEGGPVGAFVNVGGGIAGLGVTVGTMTKMSQGLHAVPGSGGAVAASMAAGIVGFFGLAGVGLAVRA